MQNNRKRTKGRNIQVIYLKDSEGQLTGKTKVIKHLPKRAI